MQNPHLVHEEDPVADLPDKHHGVHLRQLVVLIHDPLEELTTLDAVYTDTLQACFRAGSTHCTSPATRTHYSMNRTISCEVSMAAYS